MEAVLYENFIRQSFQCGRDIKQGADASLYRDMEMAYRDLTLKSMFKSDSEREYEFRKQFSGVRSYVQKALKEGIKQIMYSADQPSIDELNKMESTLRITFFDKDELDRIISRSSFLFRQFGLVAR